MKSIHQDDVNDNEVIRNQEKKLKNGKIKKWEKCLKIGKKWEKFQNKKHCNKYRKIRIWGKKLRIKKLKQNEK